MSQPWPYPGAGWWKFDFHTHTPTFKDTNALQAAIGTPNEVTPQAWLLRQMAAKQLPKRDLQPAPTGLALQIAADSGY
ncbi:hypothetical protein [Caballeronia sp. BR00000012568055]|uniref:hypothetical protein n=1 Tax=Caballeronia sp. BR00000012568055 TaxID=2918761 RepID=UPI0023F70561|nr:hypothetical protein [Caballeronia sp. BR00000012568055]